MPLTSLICGAIDRSLNTLLSLDPGARQRLKPLLGHTLCLQLREYGQPLYFVFTTQRVEVLGRYEGPVVVTLGFSLAQLPALTDSQQITALLKSEQLTIDGELEMLQHFAALLAKLDIDWAEQLAPYTGDVFAHQLEVAGRQLHRTARQWQTRGRQRAKDYLLEELRLAPGRLEFTHFCDDIERLQHQLKRLEEQLNHLDTSS